MAVNKGRKGYTGAVGKRRSGSVGREKQEAERYSVQDEGRKWTDFQPRDSHSDRCWPKHCSNDGRCVCPANIGGT